MDNRFIYKKSIFLLGIFTCFALGAFGQIASFSYFSNFDDDINGYSPTVFGNPSIETVDGQQVVRLEGDEFFSLPNALHESIDPNQDVEIHVRFKITDTYLETPYSGTGEFGEDGRRVLLSNRYFDWDGLGFDIYTQYDGEDLRILMGFGDGQNDGQRVWNVTIQEDEWIDLRMTMRFNNPRPSVVFKLNGIYNHTTIVPMYVNTDILKNALDMSQLWIGTAMDDDLQWGNYAYAETLIDYLKIYNPPYVGNPTEVSNSLNILKDHLTGIAPLTETEQKAEVTHIVNHWDDNTYQALSTEIHDYMDTYANEVGTVHEFYPEMVSPEQVEAPRALQFMLIQYLVDNLYNNDNVTSMSGVSVLDHEVFPGSVDPAAPRITETVTIDGDYNTNPAILLNQQEFVIRPTGYYVAPGELVTITLPSSMVNQGVIIHVGAHYIDLREDSRYFGRYPMMATLFPVDNTSLTLANPFGGAVYVRLPNGSNFGSVSMTISNAVKSPYYSTKTGFTNDLSQWQTDVTNAHVNWVDLESDNFQATFPRALAEIELNADLILNPLNDIIAQFNIMTGRPFPKIRAEYMISEPQSYTAGTYPAGYPISIPNGDLTESDVEALPVSVVNPTIFRRTYDATTLVHELGHLHNMPTMDEEGETNIDVPNVMGFNTVLGMPLDTALYYSSGFQFLDGDGAALDWILDPKFRKNQETDYFDVSYQLRGVAKYVDVARLFSWDSLGLIHKFWYDAEVSSGELTEGTWWLSSDDFVQVASDQLGFNFAPLWHLWGNIPTQAKITALEGFPKEHRIKDRILHYRSLVPANLAEFQTVHSSITPDIEEHHRERYDAMLTYYDESVADSIYLVIDDILCTYFDTNCDLTSVDVELDEDCITLLPNPTDGIFEIVGLMADYNIKIVTANGSVIRSINCTANSHFIDISELPPGILFVQITNENNALISLEKIIKQ